MTGGRKSPWVATLGALALLAMPTPVLAAPTIGVRVTSGPEGVVSTASVSFAFEAEGTEGATFHCALDRPTELRACSSPESLGPLALGVHTFYVTATKEGVGFSPLVSRTFTIAAANGEPGSGGGSSTAPGAAPPTKASPPAPAISSVSQSAVRWREGTALPQLSSSQAQAARGTTFAFSLNEAATVRLAFARLATGRSVQGRCVAQTKRNRRKRACRRKVAAGGLSLSAVAGANRVHFEGRISAARKLTPGRYTLALSASAGGLTSARRTLAFTILARP